MPLYREAWLDRPQGLLLTYRLLLALDPDGGTIRLGAVVAGTLITLAVGAAGWQLAGRRAGVVAATLYAAVGVAPRLEGFTLNGELLAGVPATVAVVAALRWRRHSGPGWLVAAGLAAGTALTMKPSGVDGLTATLAVLAVTTGRRLTGYGLVLAGAAGPLGLCALHGLTVGWSHYWHALAGYQLAAAVGGTRTGADDRSHALLHSLGVAAPELATLGLVAAVALTPPARRRHRGPTPARHRRRATPPAAPDHPPVRRHRPEVVILAGWLAGGLVGVNLGGSYWPHYWVQLLPPLSVLAAVAVTRIGRPALRAGLVGVVLLPHLAWFVALVPASPQQRRQAVPYAEAARRDARIAAVIRAATGPEDQIFVLVSQADLYFLTDRRTGYPYLWGKPIEKIPDALPRLHAMLDGSDRPRLVVLNHDSTRVDPSGETSRILAARYRPWSTVEGVPLLHVV